MYPDVVVTIILQVWIFDMGMAARDSWLHTSLHICYTLQVSAPAWHGLALFIGILFLLSIVSS